MRIRLNFAGLLVSALLLSLSVCRAQVIVPPSVSFGFGTNAGDGTQLWDLSGSYGLSLNINLRNGIQVPMTFGFNLIQDASGNLSSPTNDFQNLVLGDPVIGPSFTVTYKITGKVTGSGGAARARFTIRMTGNGIAGGVTVDSMSAILVVDASPNSGDGQLEGVTDTKFSAKFSNGIESINGSIPATDFATALPPGVDGSWGLTLQLAGFNSLSGTAIITTSSHIFGFIVEGPFKNDTFNVSLRSTSELVDTTFPGPTALSSVGSSAKASIDSTFETIVLNGKVMGQKLILSSE